MKRFVAFCLLVIVPGMLSAQSGPDNLGPNIVTLERGQVLDLLLVTPLDSGHAHVEDEITFTLERDLNANGLTVLPKSSIIHGRITKVVRSGKNCKEGRVRWELEPLRTASGKKIKVQSIPEYLAKPGGVKADRVSLDTTGSKIGIGATYVVMAVPVIVVFAPVIVASLILLAIRRPGKRDCHGTPGQEKSVAPGAHFYFAVSKDMRLVQSPALPIRCDTPETVTDSQISATHCY
jgi:hypothetical protein